MLKQRWGQIGKVDGVFGPATDKVTREYASGEGPGGRQPGWPGYLDAALELPYHLKPTM